MVDRNENLKKLHSNYLFSQIALSKNKILEKNPKADIISLGVGDTTQPISHCIRDAFKLKSNELADHKTYTGYMNVEGDCSLRSKIRDVYYGDLVQKDEIFISDGSKCDLGRLQFLFGPNITIAVQDPSYPAYIAASVIAGSSGNYDAATSQYKNITYIPCSPDNNFFADLSQYKRTDLIYVCSPNNPTGNALTSKQLENIVKIATEWKSIIIYDNAYSQFIQSDCPKSIYEIKGAEKVAIEIGSFSKSHGFTGIRLGWTVVPKDLIFNCGASVRMDWLQVLSTYFNGASNIAQKGGIAALSEEGIKESKKKCQYYLENSMRLKDFFINQSFSCYGGDDAPYVWLDLNGGSSWDMFNKLLEKAHIVTTPGAGFGPSGEGFIRLSGFGTHEQTIAAVERMKEYF